MPELRTKTVYIYIKLYHRSPDVVLTHLSVFRAEEGELEDEDILHKAGVSVALKPCKSLSLFFQITVCLWNVSYLPPPRKLSRAAAPSLLKLFFSFKGQF